MWVNDSTINLILIFEMCISLRSDSADQILTDYVSNVSWLSNYY